MDNTLPSGSVGAVRLSMTCIMRGLFRTGQPVGGEALCLLWVLAGYPIRRPRRVRPIELVSSSCLGRRAALALVLCPTLGGHRCGGGWRDFARVGFGLYVGQGVAWGLAYWLIVG